MRRDILDVCCGSKMFYFDKDVNNVVFNDNRDISETLCDGRKLEIHPDHHFDFRNLGFPSNNFNLVIFDPPHLIRVGDKSWMFKKYGKLDEYNWQQDLAKGFDECWRVLKSGGTLIFKWNETQIKLKEVLNCFSQKPLFGHTTTQNLKTHWIIFYKGE